MRKIYLILVISLICILFTSCGEPATIDIGEYAGISWDDYLTLPDYDSYEINSETREVTEDDIDSEIKDRLAKVETEGEKITEGTVNEGDKINISFKGTLDDGTTMEGLSGDDFNIVLGNSSFISGFQEGLYGKNVGDTVELDLTFPDPYEPNNDLSGRGVKFMVTINYKLSTQELTEEFIKDDTEGECSTEEEYRAYIGEYLEKMTEESRIFDIKNDLYYRIVDETEIKDIPENVYEHERTVLENKFTNYAMAQGKTWEAFLEENFGTAEDYDKEIDEYTKEQAHQKMVVYALCDKEGISVTEEEYQAEIQKLLDGYGVDEDGFLKQYGISIQDYAEAYNLPLNIHLEKFLDKLYERLK